MPDLAPRSQTIPLSPPQLHAARYVIARVRAEVRPQLVQASLFGSRARGDARADSDVDLLLVFHRLPPDREPYASQAEVIAREEARRLRIPVSVWSVALIDLAVGNRTPMLVDALADSIPLWYDGEPLPRIPFTERDALCCTSALLRHTADGSSEFAWHLDRGDLLSAARRLRDDLVRLCTATNLLAGVTQPRRADAVRALRERETLPPGLDALLQWAERSFGPDGTDEQRRVEPPSGWLYGAARELEALRREVEERTAALRDSLQYPTGSHHPARYREWSLLSDW